MRRFFFNFLANQTGGGKRRERFDPSTRPRAARVRWPPSKKTIRAGFVEIRFSRRAQRRRAGA